MTSPILKLFSGQAWKRVALRTIRNLNENQQRKRVLDLYHILGPVSSSDSQLAIVADGLWDNPNHFFRLRLFLEAQPNIASMKLIGIVRTSGDRTIEVLKTLGFSQFVMIDENPLYCPSTFAGKAQEMLESVNSHWDLLNLTLPYGVPAYTFYDTVLKIAKHPHPPLNSPLWAQCLAEFLSYCAIYDALFNSENITQVVLSHPWKSEYATLFWRALTENKPSYHLTGYCDGIRIRLFKNTDEYSTPIEILSFDEFLNLPIPVHKKLVENGRQYLTQRESGLSSDINAQYAFHPETRASSKKESLKALNIKPGRKLGVIYSHVWFDFPHTYAMKNFTDFQDWIKFTIDIISKSDDMDWLLKPHPTETWYGGVTLKEMCGDLPPHVHVTPHTTDSLMVLTAADVVVTVHGTVGMEAAAHGVPVIAADHNSYEEWGFVHQATSRDNYAELLKAAHNLPAVTNEQRERALALISITMSPMPRECGGLKILCDSSGPQLHKDIVNFYTNNIDAINCERTNIGTWQHESSSSYAVSVKLKHFLDQGLGSHL
ncbi:capsular polysaccharide export protein, LipB/KpsS family [Magnetovibrio blakemorei]|uniref:Capsule polysaccharide biosynthesis protein n=1 Tax=Magnetovibrio blakemorei TaxID=28181 RepID=A0A1E5Q6P6_9PROT|nr:hypothetical protein [Magnetovibrio blakemorei]OEJ66329.1 hypothetical protein BEN30_12305 [Magnetovibrio blakemorei]